MAHSIFYDSALNCVVLRVEGVVTVDRIRKMAPEVAQMCQETGCRRFLNDMSATRIDISVAALFDSPKIMDDSGVTRLIKRALVVPPDFTEASFLENVTRNSGHNFKVFKDMDEAKKWLLAE